MPSNNTEYMREYMKKYNAEKQEKVTCECGGKYKQCNKYPHLQTEKHQNFVNGIVKHTRSKKQTNNAMNDLKTQIERLEQLIISTHKNSGSNIIETK